MFFCKHHSSLTAKQGFGNSRKCGCLYSSDARGVCHWKLSSERTLKERWGSEMEDRRRNVKRRGKEGGEVMFVFANYDFRRVTGCKITQLSCVYCKLLCFFWRHEKCFSFINHAKSKHFHYITELYKLMSQLKENTFICKHLRTLPLSEPCKTLLAGLFDSFQLSCWHVPYWRHWLFV